MAKKLRALPDMGDRAVQMPANVLDPEYYLTLKVALEVLAEQAAQIETLRVALNEVRADPTTIYPPVPAF